MIEQLQLPIRSVNPIYTSHAIPSGTIATVTISGVVGVWQDWSHGIDAAYCYDAPPGSAYYPATPPKRKLHIQTNHGHFDPQPPVYNPGHHYTWQFVGTGQPLALWFNDYYYDDNSGSFFITVSW